MSLMHNCTMRGLPYLFTTDEARAWDNFSGVLFNHMQWERHPNQGTTRQASVLRIAYLTKDQTLCAKCANEHLYETIDPNNAEWHITSEMAIHGDDVKCDCCGKDV